jgi:NTE family protein
LQQVVKQVFRGFFLSVLALVLMSCALRPPNIAIPKKLPPVQQPKRPIRVALVLGSGGARGYAHLGVLRVLAKAGVPIDFVAGASVGSIVGALYADHGRWQEAYNAMMLANFWTFADISVIPHLSGIMTGYHLQDFLFKHLSAKSFAKLHVPLAVVTTDLLTGKEFVIQSGPIVPAATASSSIPGLVQPAHLYGRTLVDGGVVDPVPVDIARRYHPKLIIAVGIGSQLSRVLPVVNVEILSRSMAIMGHKLSKISAKRADVLISPKLAQSGTFDVSNARFLIHQGEVAAKKALPKILRLMKQRGIARLPH